MLLQFGEVLDRPDHLAGVGVLVVVPRDDLDLVGVVVDLADHGLGRVEQRAVLHADDVGRDDLVGVVAEGLGRLGLHSLVDALFGDILALDDGDEDGGGTGRGRDALSGADQLAVELGDDQTDRLSGAGAVGNDVLRAGSGPSEVALALRTVEDHLVAGVGVDGGHDAADDGSVVVESLSHRSEAVGGAGRSGDDGVLRLERLVVDVVDDGGKIVARGSGDDDLARAGVDVSLRLRLAGVEAGALEHDVDLELLPREVGSLGHSVDGDLLAVDGDAAGGDDGLAVLSHDGVLVGHLVTHRDVVALHGVVLEKMSEHLGAGEVVDSDDFVTFGAEHLSERKSADAAEAVDSYSDICHNI